MLPGDGVAGMLLAADAKRDIARHVGVVGTYGHLVDICDKGRAGERTAGRFGERLPLAVADAEFDAGDGVGVCRQQVAVEVAVRAVWAYTVELHARILLEEHRVAAVDHLLLDAVACHYFEVRIGHRDVDRKRLYVLIARCGECRDVDGIVHVDVDMLHVGGAEAGGERFAGGERQRQGGACLIVGIFVNTLKGDEVGCKVEHLRGGASGGARTRDFALGVAAAVQKGKALHEQQEHKGQVESVFHDESFFV